MAKPPLKPTNMLRTQAINVDRISTLISGNFTRKEFRNLTIDQMLELGRLAEAEGLWQPGKAYYCLDNDSKFEYMFDPKYQFHRVLDRIEIFVGRKGEVFFSERAN
jgi:hypothetical protein